MDFPWLVVALAILLSAGISFALAGRLRELERVRSEKEQDLAVRIAKLELRVSRITHRGVAESRIALLRKLLQKRRASVHRGQVAYREPLEPGPEGPR